ncbi:MAG: phosphotransferase [Mycobacterium sp.]|nr:phosphotransferase [Mycobacterium sp.]
MTQGPAVIPASIDEVTPQWLTDALGREVSAVAADRIAEDSGFASFLYRVHLTGASDLPETVIVKLPGTPEARGAMEMLGGYRRELEFYRRVAGRAPMAAPRVHVAEIGASAAEFVLVMEDLAGWTNADHLAGLSMEQARLAIAGLAGLHAWSVDPANAIPTDVFPNLDSPAAREVFLPVFELAWPVYLEHAGVPVPPSVAEFAERFTDYAAQALDVLGNRRMLLHGDIRADNLFFSGDAMKVVDFQFTCYGAGAADVAYLVSQGLPSDVRRGHDRALLREYLAELARHGVTDYSCDAAWRDYRMATAYLIVLPVITLMGWDAMPERSRRLCLELTRRAVATIDEIDALEAFA